MAPKRTPKSPKGQTTSPNWGPGEGCYSDFVQSAIPTAFLACFLPSFWHTFCFPPRSFWSRLDRPQGFPGCQDLNKCSNCPRPTVQQFCTQGPLQHCNLRGPPAQKHTGFRCAPPQVYILIYHGSRPKAEGFRWRECCERSELGGRPGCRQTGAFQGPSASKGRLSTQFLCSVPPIKNPPSGVNLDSMGVLTSTARRLTSTAWRLT